jgi:hypothetical protein
MAKSLFKDRRKEPTQILGSRFEAGLLELEAGFLKNDALRHSGSKGTNRENVLSDFLESNLPSRYGISRGEAIDIKDNVSPQLDILIYDKTRSKPFLSEENTVIPIEALLASIEVKSNLTSQEIEKSVVAAAKLRGLRPFGEAGRAKNFEKNNPRTARVFHCLFAYKSDLAPGEDQLTREFKRISEALKTRSISFDCIDRVYVMGCGMIHLENQKGLSEKSGHGLMAFYLHLLNFIDRESSRRADVPYLDYFGRESKTWIKL